MTSRARGRRYVLVAGFLLAFAMRGAYLFSAHENWDLDTYREVVRILEDGGELYRDTPRYNYSPAWAIVLASGAAGVPLERAVGTLLLLADVLTAWLVFRIARDVLGRSGDRVQAYKASTGVVSAYSNQVQARVR